MIELEIADLTRRIAQLLDDDSPEVRDSACVMIAERDRLQKILVARMEEPARIQQNEDVSHRRDAGMRRSSVG